MMEFNDNTSLRGAKQRSNPENKLCIRIRNKKIAMIKIMHGFLSKKIGRFNLLFLMY